MHKNELNFFFKFIQSNENKNAYIKICTFALPFDVYSIVFLFSACHIITAFITKFKQNSRIINKKKNKTHKK